MFADIVIILIIVIFVLDLVLMSIYTRVMSRLDLKRKSFEVKNTNVETKKDAPNNAPKKKKTIRTFIFFMLDHFLYGLMRYSVIFVGKIPSGHIRNWLYRFVFNMKITKKTVIYGGSEIRSPWNLHADNCVFSNNCILDCRNEIIIGENVVFGGGVHVWTEEHSVNSPTFAVLPENKGSVVIDNHAWICSDSTILPGVHVGEGAVLASRAVATKNLEPFGIYAGIPAKKIGERNNDLIYELSGKTHWHFY